MKKIILALILLVSAFSAISQENSVEKSTFSIQTGILGIWVNNEARLNDQIALRSEIGLDAGFFGGSRYYDGTGYILIPTITLEPRWYYNLEKRASRSKKTADNGGNFIALKTSFIPDWFVISNYDNIDIINQLTIIPTWGIKRNIGTHLNYEAGFGIGYRHSFAKSAGFADDESDVAANLHLRFGYKF